MNTIGSAFRYWELEMCKYVEFIFETSALLLPLLYFISVLALPEWLSAIYVKKFNILK